MTAEKKHLFSPALKRMIDMGMQYDRAYIRRCMAQRYNCSIGRILTWKEYNGAYGVTDALKRVLAEVDAETKGVSIIHELLERFKKSIPDYTSGGIVPGGIIHDSNKILNRPKNAELEIPNNLRNYKKIDTEECVPGQACDLATCRGRFEYCAACDMVM